MGIKTILICVIVLNNAGLGQMQPVHINYLLKSANNPANESESGSSKMSEDNYFDLIISSIEYVLGDTGNVKLKKSSEIDIKRWDSTVDVLLEYKMHLFLSLSGRLYLYNGQNIDTYNMLISMFDRFLGDSGLILIPLAGKNVSYWRQEVYSVEYAPDKRMCIFFESERNPIGKQGYVSIKFGKLIE